MLKPLIAASIETILNQTLKLEPELSTLMQPLLDKTLAVNLTDWQLALLFIPQHKGFKVLSQQQPAGNVILQGKLRDLLHLGLTTNPQAIFASGQVQMEGDAEVLSAYQRFMQQLHLDWEGLLGRCLGPSATYLISQPIKQLSAWQKMNWQLNGEDFKEYLTEEACVVPARIALEDFYQDLAKLRADVDRLEARIQRLRKTSTR
jgi:ubiquinone biosynthesis protein UbiJ